MVRIKVFGLFAALFLLLSSSVMAAEFGHSSLTIITHDGRNLPFQVELAETSEQHAQGLMYRTNLPVDHGMLFDFHVPQSISMWMKNTLIPLDMLFILPDGTVHAMTERAIPQSTSVISSHGDVLGVLELAGGTVARLHIQVGDRIDHPMFGKK